MVTTPATSTAQSITDHEAYEIVAKIFSKSIADQVTEALKKLQDPNTFRQATRSLQQEQAREEVDRFDPMDLYNGFWTLYTGCTMDLAWANDAAVPSKSAVMVEPLGPTQQPISVEDAKPRGGFGIGVGPFSFHVEL
jgi:hypothetical protein